MFAWEKHVRIWQLVGAVLAVPAGIAGTYSVYHNYVSGGVSCDALRGSIIAVLDKNLAPEAKRTLLRHDVEQFTQNCGAKDPDAQVIFEAAMAPAPATPRRNAAAPGAIFGLSRSGEKRGWVALFKRSAAGSEPNFETALPITAKSLPEIGAVLTARIMVPVWLEAPPVGQTSDPSDLQGRIAAGTCVKVVSRGPSGRPYWAEVEPQACPQTN
jgi:hypothetical protein